MAACGRGQVSSQICKLLRYFRLLTQRYYVLAYLPAYLSEQSKPGLYYRPGSHAEPIRRHFAKQSDGTMGFDHRLGAELRLGIGLELLACARANP